MHVFFDICVFYLLAKVEEVRWIGKSTHTPNKKHTHTQRPQAHQTQHPHRHQTQNSHTQNPHREMILPTRDSEARMKSHDMMCLAAFRSFWWKIRHICHESSQFAKNPSILPKVGEYPVGSPVLARLRVDNRAFGVKSADGEGRPAGRDVGTGTRGTEDGHFWHPGCVRHLRHAGRALCTWHQSPLAPRHGSFMVAGHRGHWDTWDSGDAGDARDMEHFGRTRRAPGTGHARSEVSES